MSALLGLVAQGIHLVLMLAAAAVLPGVVGWIEARLAGRAAAPLLQGVHDMRRALRRLPAVPEGASWLFRLAPVGRLGALLVAAMLVPGFTRHMALMPFADLLAIAGLLALARMLGALAALDEGNTEAGLGAARVGRAALAEPALLLVVFALAVGTGETGLASILAAEEVPGWAAAVLPLGLALVLAADDRRAATAELSGRFAALAMAGDAVRLAVWLGLVAALFLPPGLPAARLDPALTLGDWLLFLPVWGAKLALLAGGVAAGRVFGGRGLPGVAAGLAVLGVAMLFAGQPPR